ncbi:hypothetical protein DM02DRAFT_703461, partial [Periconia macrospinosa]
NNRSSKRHSNVCGNAGGGRFSSLLACDVSKLRRLMKAERLRHASHRPSTPRHVPASANAVPRPGKRADMFAHLGSRDIASTHTYTAKVRLPWERSQCSTSLSSRTSSTHSSPHQANPNPEKPRSQTRTSDGMSSRRARRGSNHGNLAQMSNDLFQMLIAILNDNDSVDAILRQPRDALDDAQRERLQIVSKYFMASLPSRPRKRARTAASSSQQNANGDRRNSDNEGDTAPKNQRFKAVLSLTSLQVAPEIYRHMEEHGTEVRAFLDIDSIRHGAEDQVIFQPGGHTDALIYHYRYTKELQDNMRMGRLRTLMLYVLWHDVVMLVRPNCSGSRIGHLMMTDIQHMLGGITSTREGVDRWPRQYPIDVATADIHGWCKMGGKLSILVDRFGIGCIFFLDQVLSDNFLANKLSSTGREHDEGMAHLVSVLRLPDLIQISPGVVELGQKVRESLIAPFRVAAGQTVKG